MCVCLCVIEGCHAHLEGSVGIGKRAFLGLVDHNAVLAHESGLKSSSFNRGPSDHYPVRTYREVFDLGYQIGWLISLTFVNVSSRPFQRGSPSDTL